MDDYTNYIYLDRINDKTGRLDGTEYRKKNKSFFTLLMTFESEGKCAVAMQDDTSLGQRLSKLFSNKRFENDIIRIAHESGLYYFYRVGADSNQILVGLLSDSEQWTETEDKQWLKNNEDHFTDEKQALFFGRSVEDIKERRRDKYDRQLLIKALEVQNAERTLSDFVKLDKPILAYGAAIKGACFEDKNQSYYGHIFINGANANKLVSVVEDHTLFVLSPDEIQSLINQSEGNVLHIFKYDKNDNSKNCFDHRFFEFISSEIDTEDFYMWIKFEDLSDGKFNSYFFAVVDNQDSLYDVAVAEHESSFLRYIMFLRSLLTTRLERLNDRERENTRIQAVRSAIATIMSRNMSHNLGSHVLYYTQRDLLEKAELFSSRVNNNEDIESLGVDKFLRGASYIVGFMKNRTNYIAALSEDTKYPALPVSLESEIINPLLIDETSVKPSVNKPTVNYYLRNIVRSEGFTREDYFPQSSSLRITLDKGELTDEQFRYLSLSFPGGVLSIQALYNIVENFIRNSAKYWVGHNVINKQLEFIIKISITGQYRNQLSFVIYDNKGDAEGLMTSLQEKLHGKMSILNEDNSINKEDKGIKEILLSYLWLCSNTYNDSLSSFVYKLDMKDKSIMDFVKSNIKYVTVNEKGKIILKGKNLGLCFNLPLHIVAFTVTKEKLSSIQGVSMDVVSAKNKVVKEYGLSAVFPRLFIEDKSYEWELHSSSVEEVVSESMLATKKLYLSICDHFGVDVDQYKIWLNEFSEEDDCQDDKLIFFDDHLSGTGRTTYETLRHYYDNLLYVDSISGMNYTKTLEQLFGEALVTKIVGNRTVTAMKTWRSKQLSLKIKESAITRITLIDERLFQEIKEWIDIDIEENKQKQIIFQKSQVELSLKNIRVLNWAESRDGRLQVYDGKSYHPVNRMIKQVDDFPVFCGNEFRRIGPYAELPNKTNFVSIHLGLIEKMLKDSSALDEICGERGSAPLSNQRIMRFIEKINNTFSPDFICIHSGRGGLSKELEDTCLNQYPFIPFVTLESLFNDSKFLLSQMFYSLKYKQLPL